MLRTWRPVVLLLTIFLLLNLGPVAHAQSRIDCDAFDSKVLKHVVHYCVYLPAGYDSAPANQSAPQRYPALYFLHGLGDNEQTLFHSGGWTLLDDLRRQHKIGEFLVVAPEGRRSFYINSADGSVRYSDFVLREFIPHIESKYRIHAGRSARAISGISISAASAQSAALITESPQELDAAAHSGTPLGRVLAEVFGNPIDASHWNHNSPFVLAKKNAAGLRKLAIYFNCGQDDNYGFEKGAEALHLQLQKENIPHEYHAYAGDHSLSYFLAHFSEIMQFHSQAFGLSK